ncbi:LamG-like jellyroll fold domain-containing protein [Streptomyces sp. NPDC048659]|uniref:LamG-like jellyroll fold domain-containing protein n=1 Tax=Streptomyces sp. NPDC048659 TaxID=3155489 RepID=UPI003441E575
MNLFRNEHGNRGSGRHSGGHRPAAGPGRRPGAWRVSLAALAVLLPTAPALGLAAAAPAEASGTRLSADGRLGTQQVLFRSGTAGYGCFRIPTLVRTAKGTLLAFAEGRTSPSCADRGPIDVVMRRSTNDGRTWSPIRTVLTGTASDPDAPYVRGNASPVAEKDGAVLLLSNSETATPVSTRLSWVQRSDDDGLSFGAPKAIPRLTANGRKWFGTGPSHGIQLQEGPHAGRLVVGAYETADDAAGAEDQRAGFLYSDDKGETWAAGGTENSFLRAGDLPALPPGTTAATPVAKPGEPVVAELPGGQVYVSARSPYDVRVSATDATLVEGHRTHAVAVDDPATGTPKVPRLGFTRGFKGPDVQVGLLAPRQTYRGRPGDLLLMSTPSHMTQRQGMRIRWSDDRGETWQDAPGGQVAAAIGDRAGYSDLAELSAGEIGMVHEGGRSFSAENVYFTRFAVAELGLPGTFAAKGSALPAASPDAGRTSPDTTPDAHDALLGSGAALGTGARFGTRGFGQGLALDGSAAASADLPYAPGLDPGAGDVTYSLFFRYDATAATPQQTLLWAYGVGDPRPQVWVRVQPKDDQVMARVEGDSGRHVTLTLKAPAHPTARAFGDGQWHHLTLTRQGGTVTVAVDGLAAQATGTDLGRLAPARTDDPSGIRLGDKPGTDPNDGFTGTLDEFRLYGTALTAGERDALRGARPEDVAPAALRAHLPFEVIDTADPVPLVNTRIQDDVSGHCADGTVLGTTSTESAVVKGRIGAGALKVGPDLPGVEVPYVPAVDNGAGEFTFALWFRYDATASPQDAALLWAYGSTSGKPSLWVRAKPSADRLTARLETPGASVPLDVIDTQAGRSAFGDNAWHLLTLTRRKAQPTDTEATVVSLRVDNGTPATAEGLTGSFTDGIAAPEGLRVGSKSTGTDVLTGELDDFRYYKRALTAAEETGLYNTAVGGSSAPRDPHVWWTMEGGHTEQHLVARPADDPAARATPDSSRHCGHGVVRAGGTVTDTGAKFGRSLVLDGTTGAVDLPYGEDRALGAGDFTLATWVRFRQSANTSPVLAWAYGVGTAERQLWIRAMSQENKVVAHVQTDRGITSLEAVAPAGTVFGDDTWRHVVLRRQGGTLTLSVGDGTALTAVASGPVAGSLTVEDGFDVRGLRLGGRPDSTGADKDRLTGALDEFTLVRRALSDTEITTVTGPLPDGGATAVRLAFDRLTAKGVYARL